MPLQIPNYGFTKAKLYYLPREAMGKNPRFLNQVFVLSRHFF
jgi:hypothetical protein